MIQKVTFTIHSAHTTFVQNSPFWDTFDPKSKWLLKE